MSSLASQVILVTGCSSGIGRALAGDLARRGHTVVATARRLDSLEPLREHPGLTRMALDVDDRASVAACVAEVVARFGRIDILVNNAGFTVVGPLAEVPLGDVERILATNVVGILGMVQAVVPHMAAVGRGRIANLGSIVGVLGTPFSGAYCASKAAVHMVTDVLRLELAPFGLDVISVEPGRVRSEIANNARLDMTRYEAEGSLYRPFVDGIRRRHGASQVGPTPTEVAAAHIAERITRARAPRVVRVGRGAHLLPSLRRFVPGRLLDWGLRRAFGLSQRPRGRP
jgi:NAD(P)-dependent dehydrogenase (short-subunit alcohol dehydrogenase family)